MNYIIKVDFINGYPETRYVTPYYRKYKILF